MFLQHEMKIGPRGACKDQDVFNSIVVPFDFVMDARILVRLNPSHFLFPRQRVTLRRQDPVPRQASAVASMPGRDAVVKARS